jgi:DNA-binding NtrC family response regulator
MTTHTINRKALVVDDEKEWLDLLSVMVSKYYRYIDKAGTFEEALSMIRYCKDGYDLIVTDIRLTDSGEENCEGITLLEKTARENLLKKCIVVTNFPSPGTRKKAEELGALYFVKGMFSRETLWDALLQFNEEKADSSKLSQDITLFFTQTDLLYET